MLHPNKSNPQRYRVWDRETRTQKYFPLTSHGQKEAEIYQRQVEDIKKMRALSRELGVNKLFDEYGRVKGLKRKLRRRRDRPQYECLSIYAAGRQTEINIDSRGFDDAFQRAWEWLLEQHEVEETLELRLMKRKARRHYFQSVGEDGIE